MPRHRAFLRWETDAGVYLVSGLTVAVHERGLALECLDTPPELASVSCSVPALDLFGRALVRSVRRAGWKRVVGLEFFGTPQYGG